MSQQAITAYHEHWTYCSQILDSLFAHLLVRSNLLFIVLLVVRLSVVVYVEISMLPDLQKGTMILV